MATDTLRWKLPNHNKSASRANDQDTRSTARNAMTDTLRWPIHPAAAERSARDEAFRTWQRWDTDFQAQGSNDDDLVAFE